MATKKLVIKQTVEQPDPQLKQEVHEAVKEATQDAKTGNVATAKEPTATVAVAVDVAPPAAYQGHDRR